MEEKRRNRRRPNSHLMAFVAMGSAWLLAVMVGIAGCNSPSIGKSADNRNERSSKPPASLLNVSYDPTRELYQEINREFVAFWEKEHGQVVTIEQSHGGAGKQARAVIDGLQADVVTLALSYDIDQIAEIAGLLPQDWQSRLPHNSCPYTSTVVFLVRKGNPKGIRDWDDLVRSGVQVITPNPKTSGGARYNYLAAWGYALQKYDNDESKAQDFVTQLIRNVPVLDSGARGATTTFVQNGIGDVLLTWENEALLAVEELGADKFEVIVPSVSILAEPPVTVIDKNAASHDALELANAYLQFLYSPDGQRIVAKHFYRPSEAKHASSEDLQRFPEVKLFTVRDMFGTWAEAQAKHFSDGGSFDTIYTPHN